MASTVSDLPFLTNVDDARPALMDDTNTAWLSYGSLKERVRDYRDQMAGPKALVFLFAYNDVDSVAAFLGACAAGHAVALFDPALSVELRRQLVDLYLPNWVFDPQEAAPPKQMGVTSAPLHSALSVLLSTSGSTGSPKLVRLTARNLIQNASSIGDVLAIGAGDIACGHLPLHYSFGLSVLTSHLLRGASVRLTKLGFTDREFWPAMREAEISHLPGVPFHFQIMQKLGYRRLNIPTVKSLAQAGGFLNSDARQQAYDFMDEAGGRFYIMYGQTEASPRMTTLTHDAFPIAPGSVGTALPGCQIKISDADEQGHGEVEFYGPNVMMGYAECLADLARGDELCGRLVTGDIGYLRDDGMLTLTGRSKRFGKIYGLRVSLDEVEAFANLSCEVAVTQQEDALLLHVVKLGKAADDEENWQRLLMELKGRYTLPASSYRVEYVPFLPRTDRGKIDYAALKAI